MGLLEDFYFNYYFVGFLIASAFGFLVGFFLVSIPNRAHATLHLGITLLCWGFVMFAYAVPSGFYHSLFSYHRYLVTPLFLIVSIYITQFFFNFPDRQRADLSRPVLIGQYLITAIVTVYFIAKTYDEKRVFNFTDHFWDFDAPEATQVVNFVAFLFILVYVVVGVWRVLKSQERRWATLTLLLLLLSTNLVPVSLNTLSQDGAVSRSLYLTMLSLFSVVGYFFIFIVFLNNIRDRTSFMVKIIGSSLVTSLAFLLLLSSISINEIEKAYDIIHKERVIRVLMKDGPRTDDIRYITRYSEYDEVFKEVYNTENSYVYFIELKTEFLNTLIHERIQVLDGSGFRYLDSLKRLLLLSPPSFAGYAATINVFVEDLAPEKVNSRTVLKHMDGMQRFIVFRRNKIRKLPDTKFREALVDYLDGQSLEFQPFVKVMLRHLERSPSHGAGLKDEILGYVAPFNAAGVRIYRPHVNEYEHYTAYMQVDLENNYVYEVGYSYRAYRDFIHPTPFKLTVLLCFFVLVIFLGFRNFFLSSLIKPLTVLMDGLKEVRKDNMEISLPVIVEDEIGFLSRTFNEMVRALRNSRKKLEEYADDLEDKVRERTQELRKSLEQINTLKLQQDGDYFLTSLLVKPLGANHAGSDRVKIDFFLKQKKRFAFRKWREEIGGDICIAHSITLKATPHTVFLNGDAMGKSMQGAGGALVLGAVFNSIIDRTRLSKYKREEQSPEMWLKQAFQDLHKVFQSFEGSMLSSVAMGVIDENTGTFYYLNAEHPWTVLYRSGRAGFIENDMKVRKLGHPDGDKDLHIRVMELQDKDIIITGSDGRDDILLTLDAADLASGLGEKDRPINENELLFLAHVENADADLNQIYEKIVGIGEQMDDISMIRVEYILSSEPKPLTLDELDLLERTGNMTVGENHESLLVELRAAYTANRNQPEILKALISLYVAREEFVHAAKLADEYIVLQPADTRMVFNASIYNMKIQNYTRSIDYDERIRMRKPGMNANLLNLAQIYLHIEEYLLAAEIIEHALNLDAENKAANRIREKLKQFLTL